MLISDIVEQIAWGLSILTAVTAESVRQSWNQWSANPRRLAGFGPTPDSLVQRRGMDGADIKSPKIDHGQCCDFSGCQSAQSRMFSPTDFSSEQLIRRSINLKALLSAAQMPLLDKRCRVGEDLAEGYNFLTCFNCRLRKNPATAHSRAML